MTKEYIDKSMVDFPGCWTIQQKMDWKKARKTKTFWRNEGGKLCEKPVSIEDWDWKNGRFGANVTFKDGHKTFTYPCSVCLKGEKVIA